MIAAMAKDRVIGLDNKMPWHLPADLAWFKKNTLNKPIVMGRKTFESIGRPLPDRRNLILTRNMARNISGCELFNSTEAILANTAEASETMIIGGAQLYQQFLPMTERLYLTLIDAKLDGDAFFPDYNISEWKESFREQHNADSKNAYSYTFVILDKIKPGSMTSLRHSE